MGAHCIWEPTFHLGRGSSWKNHQGFGDVQIPLKWQICAAHNNSGFEMLHDTPDSEGSGTTSIGGALWWDGCIIYVKSVFFAHWAVSFSKWRAESFRRKLCWLQGICFLNTPGCVHGCCGWVWAEDTPHTVCLQLFDVVVFTNHKHSWAADHHSSLGLLPAPSRWRHTSGPNSLPLHTLTPESFGSGVPMYSVNNSSLLVHVCRASESLMSSPGEQEGEQVIAMRQFTADGVPLPFSTLMPPRRPCHSYGCVLFYSHFQCDHSKFVYAFFACFLIFLLVDMPGPELLSLHHPK